MKTIEKPRTVKTTRPASKWRNKYLSFHDWTDWNGTTYRGGQECWADPVWPSRDIAETHGQDWEAQSTHGIYLGAFPLGAA